MGGFDDVNNWENLEAQATQVAEIQGLSESEKDQLLGRMRKVVNDAANVEETVGQLSDLLTAIEEFGVKGALLGLLKL